MPSSDVTLSAPRAGNPVTVAIGSQVRDRASQHVGRVIALTRDAFVLRCDYPGRTLTVTGFVADAEPVPFTVHWPSVGRDDEHFPSLETARARMVSAQYDSTLCQVMPGSIDAAPRLVASWSIGHGWRSFTRVARARV